MDKTQQKKQIKIIKKLMTLLNNYQLIKGEINPIKKRKIKIKKQGK
jgi:hypothetical protein